MYCRHKRDISIVPCPLFSREQHLDQFGGTHSGEVSVSLKGQGITNINYDAEDDCSPCEDAYNEEMMKDYVRDSFGAPYPDPTPVEDDE